MSMLMLSVVVTDMRLSVVSALTDNVRHTGHVSLSQYLISFVMTMCNVVY